MFSKYKNLRLQKPFNRTCQSKTTDFHICLHHENTAGKLECKSESEAVSATTKEKNLGTEAAHNLTGWGRETQLVFCQATTTSAWQQLGKNYPKALWS